jgi:hypothetical protein
LVEGEFVIMVVVIPVALMFSMVSANAVCSVVKYSAELTFSYTVLLYNLLHGENAVESFVGSILTVQCCVKKQLQHCNKIISMGSVLDKNVS